MDPRQTSSALVRLANSIDRAKAPDRKLVVSHLRKILAAMEEGSFSDTELQAISASFEIDKKSWDVVNDFDPEGSNVYASGWGSVKVDGVEIPVRLSGGSGSSRFEVDEEMVADGDLNWPDSMTEEQSDEWIAKYGNADWRPVNRRLEQDHDDRVYNYARDVIYDAGESEALSRDPYAYYGLRRSDF